MDYAVALIVYICGILGCFVSMYGMIAFKEDKRMVNFMIVSCFAFLFTVYMGGMMVQAVS